MSSIYFSADDEYPIINVFIGGYSAYVCSLGPEEFACPDCGIKCHCLDIDWFDGKEMPSDPNNYFWR